MAPNVNEERLMKALPGLWNNGEVTVQAILDRFGCTRNYLRARVKELDLNPVKPKVNMYRRVYVRRESNG